MENPSNLLLYSDPYLAPLWALYQRQVDCWITDRSWYYNQYLTQKCYELETMVENRMARSKPTAAPKKNSWEVTFLNVTLSAEDRQNLKNWKVTPDEQFQIIAQYVEYGYKQSWSFNPSNLNHSFTLTCRIESHPNNGLAVSAFAKDPYGAIRSLAYKLDQIMPENWREFVPEDGDDIG